VRERDPLIGGRGTRRVPFERPGGRDDAAGAARDQNTAGREPRPFRPEFFTDQGGNTPPVITIVEPMGPSRSTFGLARSQGLQPAHAEARATRPVGQEQHGVLRPPPPHQPPDATV